MSHNVRQRTRTARIGVIGAGASGLSVAHHLQRAGYDHVTVLEQEPRVGGKCSSIRVRRARLRDGRRVRLQRLPQHPHDHAIGRGRAGTAMEGGHCYDPDGHPMNLFTTRQYPRILRQLATYAWLSQVRYRRVNSPGLAGVDHDLHAPFAQFCRSHGLSAMESLVGPPFTGFGYGYVSEVPAAYVLKYLDLRTLEAMRDRKRRFIWPDGVESLWSRVAQQHDVRTGTNVVRVTRSGLRRGGDCRRRAGVRRTHPRLSAGRGTALPRRLTDRAQPVLRDHLLRLLGPARRDDRTAAGRRLRPRTLRRRPAGAPDALVPALARHPAGHPLRPG